LKQHISSQSLLLNVQSNMKPGVTQKGREYRDLFRRKFRH